MAKADSALGDLANQLLESPRQLATWWQLAGALHAEDKALSTTAYADLGRAACELAAVSLSMACVLRLVERNAKREAEALLDRIARTHGQGSKKVAAESASIPPSPPRARAEDAKGHGDAISNAKKAMTKAGKVARERAPSKVPPTPLVQYLDRKELGTLATVMSLEHHEADSVVIDVGHAADALFWIAKGAVQISRDGTLLGELHSDAFFGEIALVGASTRTAKVTTSQDSELLRIPEEALGKLAISEPKLAQVLASHARQRLLSNVMQTSELFQRLSESERRGLLPRFESIFVDEGDKLLEAGQDNDALFVVVTGQLGVREGDDEIAILRVGDGLGEMSMLGRKPATHDVVALSSSVLLKVTRDKFDQIASDHPELLSEVYKLLVARERQNADSMVIDAKDLVI